MRLRSLLPLLAIPLAGADAALAGDPCPPPDRLRPSPHPPELTLPADATGADGAGDSPAAVTRADYRHRLGTTALGWPRLDSWCVWVEPPRAGPGGRWDRRWHDAVLAALASWRELLPIHRSDDPEAAQVRLRRVRPPLRRNASGRLRASHGRALLRLVEVEHAGRWILQPQVEVLISPGQRAEAIQATALHELGHAFGLWGHSDDPADAMAVSPAARAVLQLTARDRATLRWLYSQPTRFGRRPPPAPPVPSSQYDRPLDRWRR